MIILGVNAYHADSAACLVKDGELLAAAEEERFRRVKHWAGFPLESIRYCFREAGIGLADVDHVALNRDPRANFSRKILFALLHRPSFKTAADRLRNARRFRGVRQALGENFGRGSSPLKARIHPIEHHDAHLASAFLVAPFDSAAAVSLDGFGDFLSAKWAACQGGRIQSKGAVYFPHSLGLLYSAVTQHLGFLRYGDEYKVMGLAGHGQPAELEKFRRIVKLLPNGQFRLNLDYFVHHREGISIAWEDGEPIIGKVYSRKLLDILGSARGADEPVSARHRNIAASLQAAYEEVFFHVLNHVYRQTRNPNLCLAGGCAMNSVANGKIAQRTPFREVYVQAAAGDAGGALGAAFLVWNTLGRGGRKFVMRHAYWGPEFREETVEQTLKAHQKTLMAEGCRVEKIDDQNLLCRRAAEVIASGKVLGWFQGRMEWGPRALGNRSILCDPRHPGIQGVLNSKIKRREAFRPFAPSVLREKAADWFESDADVPFMLQVFPVRPEKRKIIAAVTHVDGTSRPQTVRRRENPLYHALISEFEKITGIPMVLNTSFNENEPVVCTPAEALECFLRTRMDALAIGGFFIERQNA